MHEVALIGANGMLATAIRKLAPDNYRLHLYDLPEFDLTDRIQVLALRKSSPEIIINCAAYTNVDGCEDQHELAMRVNGDGPGYLAELARDIGATLIHISTDFVFDGKKQSPYIEDDQPQPLSVYGKSKLAGEQQILQSGLEKYFIIRTSWLYGAGGHNFVETMIRLAKERTELKVVADQYGTPTWTEDLASLVFVLLQTRQYGLYHCSNMGECNWYQFACEIIDQVQKTVPLRVERVLPIPTEDYPLPAVRPRYSVMSKDKIARVTDCTVPSWRQSLEAYMNSRQQL